MSLSTEILHVLPPVEDAGKDGLCADYDADCKLVPNHAACWGIDVSTGTCPYLD